ncbi:MAG: hypothetical protein Q7J98_01920 [Kiritimatiellia bacterium]|nr:hypothetical protein [Kiritimatiellia bacterium]
MSDIANDKNSIGPSSEFWLRTSWLIAIISVLGLVAANLIFGNLNQDEGWYLYAAGLISSGKIPYRDFAFTQGPVMPFVYSLAYPLIQWGGLAAGRLFTAALGVTGILVAALLAGRLARPGQNHSAAILCFILALINVYQVYFCTVVKTYSLTILFLASALLTLHYALTHRKAVMIILAAVLLVLAAGTRSSAAVALPVIFGLLLLEHRRFTFPAWLYFAFGGLITVIFVFGPFLLHCASNFIYLVISYHTLRHEGNFLTAMMFKAGFVSRVLQAYFVCVAFWVAALAIKQLRKNDSAGALLTSAGSGHEETHNAGISSFLRRCIWISAIAVSLVHLIAPFPYDDYQVFIYPLFAIVVALMILEAVPERAGKWVVLAALCISLLSSVSSPVNQDWFIEGRDLIWWRIKEQPALMKLKQTAAKIRSLSSPADMLLTQDTYLAVEAGRALPHGLEMGQFSYFPDLTNEQAEKLNVLNRYLLANLLQNSKAPLAAFSGYAFAIQAPQITPLSPADKSIFRQTIRNRYELLETVTNFGQAATELRLYRKK